MGSGSQQAPAGGQPPGDSGRPVGNLNGDDTEAANQARSMNNLKQIILAIMAYEEANGYLPPPAIQDPKSGKPLPSWRVAILPCSAQRIYQQFDLSEAWDGPHNMPLLGKMPAVYARPGSNVAGPTVTFYQVFVGPGTAFEPLEGGRNIGIADISDVAQRTLAVVEGGRSVPWTKPADLLFDPEGPLPKLGGLFKDGFDAAFVDASVRFVGRGTDPKEYERHQGVRHPQWPGEAGWTNCLRSSWRNGRLQTSSRRSAGPNHQASRITPRSAAPTIRSKSQASAPGDRADENQRPRRVRARLCRVVGAAHAGET